MITKRDFSFLAGGFVHASTFMVLFKGSLVLGHKLNPY